MTPSAKIAASELIRGPKMKGLETKEEFQTWEEKRKELKEKFKLTETQLDYYLFAIIAKL